MAIIKYIFIVDLADCECRWEKKLQNQNECAWDGFSVQKLWKKVFTISAHVRLQRAWEWYDQFRTQFTDRKCTQRVDSIRYFIHMVSSTLSTAVYAIRLTSLNKAKTGSVLPCLIMRLRRICGAVASRCFVFLLRPHLFNPFLIKLNFLHKNKRKCFSKNESFEY